MGKVIRIKKLINKILGLLKKTAVRYRAGKDYIVRKYKRE